MVSVRFNHFAPWRMKKFYLVRSQLSFAELHTASCINQSRSFAVTEITRFNVGLRSNFCESLQDICADHLKFPVLLVACCSRKVENRYHVQPVHTSFGRYLPKLYNCNSVS